MRASAAYVEEHAVLAPFVTGDQLSLADPNLFVVANWLPGDGVPLADFPKLNAFHTLMNERASVVQAREMGILV